MKDKANKSEENFSDEQKVELNAEAHISVSEEEIRARAYELYLQRGGLYAPPEADWIQAEAELRNLSYQKKREENI